jgi:ABC-2 type transport system ATP-binding protein
MNEQHKMGRTLIFSTHAMFEAEQLCTHLFMIHQGNKVLDLPLADVWKKYDPKILHVEPLGSVDEAASKLSGLEGVVNVVTTTTGIDLRLHPQANAAAAVSAAAARVPARMVEIRRPSVEDIFVQLVGGDAAALKAELDGLSSDESNDALPRRSPAGVES